MHVKERGASRIGCPNVCIRRLKGGASDGWVIDANEVDRAISMYYEMAGWDKEGVPTRAKLSRVGSAMAGGLR